MREDHRFRTEVAAGGTVAAANDGEAAENVDGGTGETGVIVGWSGRAAGFSCLRGFCTFRLLARPHFLCAFAPEFELFRSCHALYQSPDVFLTATFDRDTLRFTDGKLGLAPAGTVASD